MEQDNTPYTFGRPLSDYVSPRQEVRLAILRATVANAAPRFDRREQQALAVECGPATVHGWTVSNN